MVYFEVRFGCIGILKQGLVQDVYQALQKVSTEFTRIYAETSVLPDAKWECIHVAARSGEAEFQFADGQNRYLSYLPSMLMFVSKQHDPVLPSFDTTF